MNHGCALGVAGDEDLGLWALGGSCGDLSGESGSLVRRAAAWVKVSEERGGVGDALAGNVGVAEGGLDVINELRAGVLALWRRERRVCQYQDWCLGSRVQNRGGRSVRGVTYDVTSLASTTGVEEDEGTAATVVELGDGGTGGTLGNRARSDSGSQDGNGGRGELHFGSSFSWYRTKECMGACSLNKIKR